ncbi:hypothetical protein Q8A64_05925 [Oxalobacteraceae bacterium R-40]|uniref:YlaH-like protein n=1 Tax=Keguizhuia sedimenti TaxID=3064264 RepID=A0ABU1BLT2_9BURK|nr:hypothetical protein [Oxalobacteraceae bacterium R-40]
METNETIWLYSAIFLCVVAWRKAHTGKQRIGATVVSVLAAAQVLFILTGYMSLAYGATIAGILVGLVLLEASRRWEVERQQATLKQEKPAALRT